MIARPFAFALAPARVYQRLTRLTVAALITAMLITMLPIVRTDRTAPLSPPIAAADTPARPSPIPATPQISAGLGPVLNATLAADSTENYAAVALAASPDALRADNPAQQFATTFTTDGVRVAPTGGAGFSMHAAAIISAGGLLPLAAAHPVSIGARVEYRRDGLTEWYINGPRGLEQGFTVAALPAGAEQFTIGLVITGAVPTQGVDGVLLLGDLRYGDLTVTDATGVTLPAHLEVADGAIQIAVDARGAEWPVTIDPSVTAVTLTASDGAGGDGFGQSVAVAISLGTTTVVVGAYAKNSAKGVAYVYTGSGGTYTQRAELTASDGVTNDHFGYSVAVTSTAGVATIVVGTWRSDGTYGQGPGKAYVFNGNGTTYVQKAILMASDNGNISDEFGHSVAIATDGTTATIVVGAIYSHHAYAFTGSGMSYPQLAEFQGSGHGYSGDGFGTSVAIANAGGTNTIVVGAPYEDVPGIAYPGDIWAFTGSGASYSALALHANDATQGDYFGGSVAVAIAHGTNTIVVGVQNASTGKGAIYALVGSGASYTSLKLIDSDPNAQSSLGRAVAVGFAGSSTVIAGGATSGDGSRGVTLFTGNGATYAKSYLPTSFSCSNCDAGHSVALMTAINGDVAVVNGAPYGASGAATLSYYQTAPTVNFIRAQSGDGGQVLASPAHTFNGDAFTIVAAVSGPGASVPPPVGVTFTMNYAGAAHGLFNPNDPTSTTLHVMTQSDGDPRADGSTAYIPVYPSDTAGTFTITATVDGLGTAPSATFTLTIVQGIPAPTIGGAASSQLTSTGINPPRIRANLPDDTWVTIYGSGFIAGYSHLWMSFDAVAAHDVQVADTSVAYFHSTELGAYLDHTRLIAGTFTDTNGKFINIYVKNSAGPSGIDGGRSISAPLYIVPPALAPAGSTAAPVAATSLLAAPGTPVILANSVKNSGGSSLTAITTTSDSLISHDGGSLVSQGGGNLISHDGGSLISHDGGSLISHDGGSIVNQGDAQTDTAHPPGAPQSSDSVAKPGTDGTPRRNVFSNLPVRSAYYGASDANGISLSPPIESNGISGTYTRTVAADGIAAPVTYTIINLDPSDGHLATITALSRPSAHTGDPAFVLTATGTGFVKGSVLSYGGVQLVTTFDSATQVHATVSATLPKYSGALDVLVINPDPNGGASLPATFTVTVFVAPLPPPQPTASPVTWPSPLPGSRQPAGPPLGNPNPLPTGR